MLENNFSFIFIGSTHNFIDDFIKQKETILSIKPEFVLCEDLENYILDSKDKFMELFDKKEISNMTSFEDVKKSLYLCFNNNIKLIGIDFHNFGFNEKLQRKIKSKEKLNVQEKLELEELLKLREKHHLEKIEEYKTKTKKPLVIIIGCWHLREGSVLRENLSNYKIIVPCDDQGKLLFEPSANGKIKYREIVSNGK